MEEAVKESVNGAVEETVKEAVLLPEENRFCDIGWWEIGVVILLRWKISNELVI
jgi:hypothetical protein